MRLGVQQLQRQACRWGQADLSELRGLFPSVVSAGSEQDPGKGATVPCLYGVWASGRMEGAGETERAHPLPFLQSSSAILAPLSVGTCRPPRSLPALRGAPSAFPLPQ